MKALTGLVPDADVTRQTWFEGRDMLAMTGPQVRDIRGQRISMFHAVLDPRVRAR